MISTECDMRERILNASGWDLEASKLRIKRRRKRNKQTKTKTNLKL